MIGKKRGRNRTSNILVSIDIKNPVKNSSGYMGKIRDFEGKKSEYRFFDSGKDPKKCGQRDHIRREFGSVNFTSENLHGVGILRRS